jgi:hypothetical protein
VRATRDTVLDQGEGRSAVATGEGEARSTPDWRNLPPCGEGHPSQGAKVVVAQIDPADEERKQVAG